MYILKYNTLVLYILKYITLVLYILKYSTLVLYILDHCVAKFWDKISEKLTLSMHSKLFYR